MKRIVHLILHEAFEQSRSGAKSLSLTQIPGWQSELLIIGRGQSLSSPRVAYHWLRKQKLDVIHAWGMTPLAVAALGARCPVICTPDAEITRSDIAWMAHLARVRPIRYVATSALMQRRILAAGVGSEQVEFIAPSLEMIEAGVSAMPSFAPDDRVIVALGESTRWAHHEPVVWAVGILNVLDSRYKLLLSGQGPHSDKLRRFSQRLHQPHMTTFAGAGDQSQLLQLASAAVVSARGPVATQPMIAAMLMGVPIIARDSPATRELLDESTATMLSDDSPRRLAQAIRDAVQSAEPAKIKAAQDRARRQFAMKQYIDRHLKVYETTTAMAAPRYMLA